MFSVRRSVPVNEPGTIELSRADVWAGLEMKARNALPFIPEMSNCVVVREESENVFFREIEFQGDKAFQRVTLEPLKGVIFERLTGKSTGVIRNLIEEDENGALLLTFAFDLELAGATPGGPEETAYAAKMTGSYVDALHATLAALRQLKAEQISL